MASPGPHEAPITSADAVDPEREALLRRALELLPNMVFAKDGVPETREDYDRGFRYVYFNAAMDHASGLDRTAMVGQNAKDHFPVHYQRYFDDDRAVMALPPAPPAPPTAAAALEIYEPWKVKTGDHVLHTRKCNLLGRYMLGTFIRVDEVHLGEQRERRRPVQPPLAPIPSDPEPGFFSHAFEALPLALLVSIPAAAAGSEAAAPATVVKNAAYRQAFGGAEEAEADAFFRGLDASAVPDEIYERSGVQLGGQRWHVAQRPIGGGEGGAGGVGMIVYAIWNIAHPVRAAEARAALKGDA